MSHDGFFGNFQSLSGFKYEGIILDVLESMVGIGERCVYHPLQFLVTHAVIVAECLISPENF